MGTVTVSLSANSWALSQELGETPISLVRPFLPWAWKSCLVVLAALAIRDISIAPLTFVPLASVLISLLYFSINYSTFVRPPLGAYVLPRLKLVFADVWGVRSLR